MQTSGESGRAIASVIAVPELLRQTQIVAGKTYRPFELYTAAMLVYFLLCYPVARGVDCASIAASRIWARHDLRLVRRLGHCRCSWTAP